MLGNEYGRTLPPPLPIMSDNVGKSFYCSASLSILSIICATVFSILIFQPDEERLASEGDCSDVAHVDTDDGSVSAGDLSDEDSDADDDDDEFVDAGDEVADAADQSPWVTERRHSGDGEVTFC